MKRSRDAARMHVLEAVVSVYIMISGITFVVLMDNPQPSDNTVYDIHQARLNDWVRLLEEHAIEEGTCDGSTMLEKHVIAGVNGEHEAWREAVERTFGPGVSVDVRLGIDGYKYPLHTSFNPPGGAGKRMYFEPAWKFLQPTLLMDPVTGTEDLVVDVAGIQGTKLIRDAGEALITTVTVDGLLESPNYRVASLTGMPSPAYENSALTRQFAQNVTWLDKTASEATLVRVLEHDDLNPVKPAPWFNLRVEPGLSGEGLDEWSIPAGMRATMRIPRDWTLDLGLTTDWNPAWSVVASGSVSQGWDVVFSLGEPASESQVIQLFARPPAVPTRPFDDIHARLGNASLGESTLVVQYPVGADESFPREAFATTPYPVRHGTRALFGVVFANGGEAATISQVDIEIPGGYDIDNPISRNAGLGAALFAEAPVWTPAGDPDPEWARVSGKHLQWQGSRNVEAGDATHWLIGVEITSDLSQATNTVPQGSDGIVMAAKFPNGYERSSTRWGSAPGVIRIEVPPESAPGAGDGYPWSLPTPPAKTVTHSYTLLARGDELRLTNSSTYQVMAATSETPRAKSAVANSTFRVLDRIAPLGSVFTADARLGSLVGALSAGGATSTSVEVALWPPSSQGCKPAVLWTRSLPALPLGAIRDLRIWDPLGGAATMVYLTGDDARVYKLDQAGTSLWTVKLNGVGLKIMTAGFGGLEHALFVGTEDGDLYRLDSSTGVSAWRTRVLSAAWSVSKTPNGVTALVVDEAGERLAIATKEGALELRSKTGVLLARHEAPPQASYLQLAFSEAGDLYARDSNDRLRRFDATLGALAESPVEHSVRGFALAQVGVLVVGGSTSVVLDETTLQFDAGFSPWTANGVGLASAGDATGDGNTDLVYTHADLTVVVRDGATGALAWAARPPGRPPSTDPGPLHPFVHPNAGQACTEQEVRDVPLYSDGPICVPVPITGEPVPHALLAQGGRVALAYIMEGANTLALFSDSGVSWSQPLEDETTPTVMAMGAWTPNDALAVGASDGTLVVHDRESGATRLDTQPTEFAGAFRFQAGLPDAGFLGAHLLSADLKWKDAAGASQAARFVDWIEIVHRDGELATRTTYDIEYLTEDRAHPSGLGVGASR